MQQLILNLSSGPIATAKVQAVNLDTWHISEKKPVIAMWVQGHEEPMYFLHDSLDAERVQAWTEMVQGHCKFFHTERFVFALAQVVTTKWRNDTLEIYVEGHTLPFVIPMSTEVSVALALWASQDSKDTTEPRAVAIAS